MNETDEAKVAISHAAKEAIAVINDAAVNATQVLANAAAEALKVNSVKISNDHDLLTRIEERMEGLRKDIESLKKETTENIKDLKNATSYQIADHETRLKKLETKTANYFITLTLYTVANAAMITLIIYHILSK